MSADPNAHVPLPTPPAPLPALPPTAPVGWVIAAMLLFWPTGIPALLASHRAARAFGAADTETALRESATAKRWGIISVCVAGGLVLLNILVIIGWFIFVAVLVRNIDD